ncbi:10920_t:CDS:1, partial [Ambispora gerdemannii]
IGEGELEQQRNLSEPPTKKLRLSNSVNMSLTCEYLGITMVDAKTTTVKPGKGKSIATNKKKVKN